MCSEHLPEFPDHSIPENRVFHSEMVAVRGYYCLRDPQEWPYWVGGNRDFLVQDQGFNLLRELREGTMLEE